MRMCADSVLIVVDMCGHIHKVQLTTYVRSADIATDWWSSVTEQMDFIHAIHECVFESRCARERVVHSFERVLIVALVPVQFAAACLCNARHFAIGK